MLKQKGKKVFEVLTELFDLFVIWIMVAYMY